MPDHSHSVRGLHNRRLRTNQSGAADFRIHDFRIHASACRAHAGISCYGYHFSDGAPTEARLRVHRSERDGQAARRADRQTLGG